MYNRLRNTKTNDQTKDRRVTNIFFWYNALFRFLKYPAQYV